MTLEIKTDRRNLTFGSGEPAISHEKAVEIVKEYARLMEIAEMVTALHQGLKPLRETYDTETIAEILYDAGYRKQVEGEWLERKGERWIGSEVCETYTYYNCSICEGESLRRTNHRPNCGVKMKGNPE